MRGSYKTMKYFFSFLKFKYLLFLIALFGAGVFIANSSALFSKREASAPANEVIVHNLRVRKDIKNFARDVDVIMIGTVKSIDGPRQNKVKGMIFSHIVVEVEQYLKNPQPGKQIKIKRLGGRIGNEEIIVEDEPQFNVGERVLLFLGTDHKKDFVVYAGDSGKFTLDNDIAIGSENERIPLADLIEQIKTNME